MEDVFSKLPQRLYIDHESPCYYCEKHIVKDRVQYTLTIEPNFQYEGKKEIRNRRIYYKPHINVSFKRRPEEIGVNVGRGYPLSECIERVEKTLIENGLK